MKVQFLDLCAQYKTMRKDILKAVGKVCDSQHFVLGANVRGFEEDIAKYCGAKYAVGVASGTDALLLSIMALGIGSGDSVLTTPYTFFSTASSITRTGARALFVDIDPKTYNIDPNRLESHLKRNSRGIKAIMPVHLYGQCADMDDIKGLARKYGLKVIEDAAQAIGATFKGRSAGSLGDLGCFSFYPSKNLGGFGDGGMVTTSNKRLADRVRILRVHGAKDQYHHSHIGINSRLDEIQATVLRLKLARLDAWTQARIKNALCYDVLFARAGLTDIVTTPAQAGCKGRHVYNQYVIRTRERDALREFLSKGGVGTAIYYPLPLHMQGCFKGLGFKKGDMPVSERAAKETLALPIYPELTKVKQAYVVNLIKEFFAR